MAEDYWIGLSPDQFAQAFPFHFVLNREMELTQIGGSLAKLMPHVLQGANLAEHFQILRPHLELSFESIVKKQKSLYVIESRSTGFQLKGQMMHRADQGVIFFIGSLWITEMEQLKQYGLKLKDFAIHEPATDFLFLLQSKNTMLSETKAFSESLRQRKIELEDAIRSVEEKNDYLNETLSRLKATQTQLVQSEKMAALGQLIAGIAHEINTPLGAIRSSIETIISFLDTDFLAFPDFFKQLSPDQRTQFVKLIMKATQSHWISAKERRRKRRHLAECLAEMGVTEADEISETLADLNIFEAYEDFMALIQDHRSASILDIAYKVASVRHCSTTIQSATDRAAKVVSALKKYSHTDQFGTKQHTNLETDIENILTLYRNHLKFGVEVVRHYESVPPLLCFADELNQVWTNLIHNALQAMEYKGVITIHLEAQTEQICVKICDTGRGILPEHLPKIFSPFFTTKPPGEGSGLGLDIVKKIVEKHQGEIHVSSEPGSTQFTVLLPITHEIEQK